MFRLFILLFIFVNSIFGSVVMHSPTKFYAGEPIIFSIEAIGSDILVQDISNIDGYVVEKNGSSSSISIVNGNRSQKLLQQYKLFPDKTVTIPSFKVQIDGKDFFTKPKIVKKVKVEKTKSIYTDFVLKVSKNELYVGEQALFTLVFKYRKDLDVTDLGFTAPNFQNFWSKQVGEAKKYEEGMFVVQELNYILFPQKSGKLIIPALKVDVSVVDERNNNFTFFGPPTRIERVFSNELEVNVKPLPKSLFLIGNFEIENKVDKLNIKAGEAVTFDILIKGRGNIDDIPEIKLDIPNATIYDNKAIKTYDMIDEKYGGVYKKTFSIVANEDILIPSISIKYFDNEENIVKELKTKQYEIKVEQKLRKDVQLYKQQKVITEPKETVKVVNASFNDKLLYFFFGLIVASLLFILFLYIIKVKTKNTAEELPLEKEVKNAKSSNELLNILLSYINIDNNLDKMIYKLENCKESDFKLIKKDTLTIIKDNKIK